MLIGKHLENLPNSKMIKLDWFPPPPWDIWDRKLGLIPETRKQETIGGTQYPVNTSKKETFKNLLIVFKNIWLCKNPKQTNKQKIKHTRTKTNENSEVYWCFDDNSLQF